MLTALKQTAASWEIRRVLQPFRDTQQSILERHFYRRLIGDSAGAIIDVGANRGSKTEIFRRLSERVVAIEPDPTSAHILRTRFCWRPEVIILQCAITEKSGAVPFYQFGPGSAFNTSDHDWAGSMMDGSNHMHLVLPKPKEIIVQARTISDVEAAYRPVKYLKIDAEGHEQQVLSTLRYPVPLISLEFNFPQMQGALLACVDQLETIASYRFNAAITEPPQKLEFDQWLRGDEIIAAIQSAHWRYAELFAQI
ncbi:MAG: FkbM family methyltransferase [Rhodomicrobium sp.]